MAFRAEIASLALFSSVHLRFRFFPLRLNRRRRTKNHIAYLATFLSRFATRCRRPMAFSLRNPFESLSFSSKCFFFFQKKLENTGLASRERTAL